MSKADRHSEALLGIHLAKPQGRVAGSPPSDEELVLLMDGQLGEPRRSEVLSHLTHRPERYRQWLSLADMDADEQASQAGLLSVLGNAVNNWLIDWRYAAGGIGTLAALVLLVNQMALPPAEQLAGIQPSTDTYAQVPETEDESKAYSAMAPKPEADAASRQQSLKMEMAEERSRSTENLTAAKRLASPARCLSALEPATRQAGVLCTVRTDKDTHELRWSAENSNQALPLITLPQWPLQLLISENNQWLAVQSHEAIYVIDLPRAFAGETSQSQLPFTAGIARMRWSDNELLISVMQALGDSDDDLIYRYQPETGEINPPSP